jgi:diguanylate cyclase (GGDEF)-like protein
LHNRRALEEILAAAVPGDTFALLDLDLFKQTNDTLGHAAGDQVLMDFARVLADSLREGDVALRFGGDEFFVYLPDTGSDHAATIIRRVRKAWAAELPAVTFSGGIATVEVGSDGTEAFGEADRYLYRAKAAGRGRCFGPAIVIDIPAPRDEAATAAPFRGTTPTH